MGSPAFNVQGALDSGRSEDDVLNYLSSTRPFDVQGALKNNYTKRQIIDHLATMSPKPPVPGMEKLGGQPPPIAPAPKPSMPDPNEDFGPSTTTPLVGGPMSLMSGPYNYMASGAQRVTKGVKDLWNADTNPDRAEAASNVIRGAGQVALPMMGSAIAAAPKAVLGGMALGGAVGSAVQKGAEYAGADPGYGHLAADVSAILSGSVGPQAAAGVTAKAIEIAKANPHLAEAGAEGLASAALYAMGHPMAATWAGLRGTYALGRGVAKAMSNSGPPPTESYVDPKAWSKAMLQSGGPPRSSYGGSSSNSGLMYRTKMGTDTSPLTPGGQAAADGGGEPPPPPSGPTPPPSAPPSRFADAESGDPDALARAGIMGSRKYKSYADAPPDVQRAIDGVSRSIRSQKPSSPLMEAAKSQPTQAPPDNPYLTAAKQLKARGMTPEQARAAMESSGIPQNAITQTLAEFYALKR